MDIMAQMEKQKGVLAVEILTHERVLINLFMD